MKLDLHGVRHEHVENTVKRFIEDNWDCNEVIVIVTGHSHMMQGYVLLELERYNLTCEIWPAEIRVKF